MQVAIADDWKAYLKPEFEEAYFAELVRFIKADIQQHTIYPPGKLIFNAFAHCAFADTRVVILGQDPYHGPGQANGLCFSVSDGIPIPPSLQNIFKEIQADIGTPIPKTGNLERWAQQGVLLLNAVLTVRKGQAASHSKKGWETFTDAVIRIISDKKENVVFMLWGKYAQQKGQVIDRQKHLVLESPHPSPLARGFAGNRHFSQANAYLLDHQKPPIQW
ncbi:MAG: uracil-DNA glycosylase [Bernardetiaceae bacterium]